MAWNRRKKRKIDPATGKREYRKKTPLQKLEKKADDLTKEIIRLIYDWKCQKCGKTIVNKSDAHRSHIVGCSHKTLRWDLLNLILLCMTCHRKLHDTELIKEFVKIKWPHRYDYLFEQGSPPLCNQTLPYRTLPEKEEWMQIIISGLTFKLQELKEQT